MAMVDVNDNSMYADLSPTQLGWLSRRVGGHLALFYMYQLKKANSGDVANRNALRDSYRWYNT